MSIGQEKCIDYPGFECAVCGHRRFYRILIHRERQPPYRTAFYGCVGCSTMFTDPYKFTQSVQSGGNRFGSSTYGRSGG